MKLHKKILSLILVIAVAEVIPYGFAKHIADFFGQYISQAESSGYFLLALIHKSAQLIFAFILIKLLFREKLSALGFNLKNKALSQKIIAHVMIIWPFIILAFFLISASFADGFIGYINNLYPPSMGWMLAKLSRDILLIDAFPEEVLYRLFVILFLDRYFIGRVKVYRWTISHATLLSVPIFVLGHISISIYPFGIIGYDPVQLLLTVFTGLLFGVAFEKSRSLYAPVIIHGYTNLIITIAGYITVFMAGV